LNILLITSDQQRADSLGAYGNRICRTPNLDGLAAQGMRFTSARCQNPFSQPSRATILTGLYPSSHGVTGVGIDMPADAMAKSVAGRLTESGYHTALFGKAHFASAFPTLPTRAIESVEGSALVDPKWSGPYAGFEHVELVLFGHNIAIAPAMGSWRWCFGPPPFGLHYARWLYRDGDAAGRERLRLMQAAAAKQRWQALATWHSALPAEDHSASWITGRATDWLQTVKEPFFGWVSFCDPHQPMSPPAPWSTTYRPEDILPAVPAFDASELEDKPRAHALWARGLKGSLNEWANPGGARMKPEGLAIMTAGYYGAVSFMDEQVGRLLNALDERGLAGETLVVFTSDHGAMLGEHGQLFTGPVHYDELLRVPLMVRGGAFKAGGSSDEPVGLIDIAPTILEAAEVPLPGWLEGRSLAIGGRDHVITENDYEGAFNVSLRTLTTSRYKITRYAGREGVGELYDLEQDPGERVNLWSSPAHWRVRNELLEVLESAINRSSRVESQVSLVG